MRQRKGVTLIEVMVATAVLVVFIYIAFLTFSSMVWQRAATRETLEIQGALRTATDRISEEVRLAGWPTYKAGSVENPYLVSPRDGQFSDSLTIVVPDASPTAMPHQVRFYIEGTAGAQRLMREECQLRTANTTFDPVAMHSDPQTQHDPLTPYFTQMVHVYFACSGGRITTVMVARLHLQGRVRDLTAVGVTYVRSYAPPPG